MKTYFRFAAIAVAALTLGVACEELTETPKDDSQNTETPETPQEPEKPAEPEKPVDTYVSIADFNAAAVSEEVTYKVKGEIVSIEEISGSFNNATLTIADESGATLYIYRMKPAGETNIADLGLTLGDILSVEGQRGEYNGKIQMVAGVYISHEDKEAPVVQITDISLADFNALEDSDVSLYRIKGTIIEIGDINEQYQNVNLTIADEAGTEVYIYRMKMADNAEQTLADLALKAGDVLTLVGNKGSYEGDPQMVNGKYESHVVGVPPVEYSIDGKQWCFTWTAMGVDAILDLGLYQEGLAVVAIDGAAMGVPVGYVPYFPANYTITATSATEGIITLVDPNDPSGSEVIITYTDLTETSVKASNELPFMLENVTLTLAEEKIDIVIPEM